MQGLKLNIPVNTSIEGDIIPLRTPNTSISLQSSSWNDLPPDSIHQVGVHKHTQGRTKDRILYRIDDVAETEKVWIGAAIPTETSLKTNEFSQEKVKSYEGGGAWKRRIFYQSWITRLIVDWSNVGSIIDVPEVKAIAKTEGQQSLLLTQYYTDIEKGGDLGNFLLPEDCSDSENVICNVVNAVINQQDFGVQNRLRRSNGRLVLIDFEFSGGICRGDQAFWVTEQDASLPVTEISQRYQDYYRIAHLIRDNTDVRKNMEEDFYQIAKRAGYSEEEGKNIVADTLYNIDHLETFIETAIEQKQERRNQTVTSVQNAPNDITPKILANP